jgi:hypothetical protein
LVVTVVTVVRVDFKVEVVEEVQEEMVVYY